MRKSLTLVMIAATVATSGCTMFKRRGNEEFTVAKSAPLVVPPDFSLAPPVTGTGGLSPADAQQQAIDTIFGTPAPKSSIEGYTIDRAGGEIAKVGIRSTVWDPDTRIVDKGPTTLQILSAPTANTEVATAQIGQ